MAQIIDGKIIAKRIRDEVAAQVRGLSVKGKEIPKLAVVLAGDDPGSQIYVRNKEKACAEVGIPSEVRRIPASSRKRS